MNRFSVHLGGGTNVVVIAGVGNAMIVPVMVDAEVGSMDIIIIALLYLMNESYALVLPLDFFKRQRRSLRPVYKRAGYPSIGNSKYLELLVIETFSQHVTSLAEDCTSGPRSLYSKEMEFQSFAHIGAFLGTTRKWPPI